MKRHEMKKRNDVKMKRNETGWFCITELAQNPSQYYFVLQNLHKSTSQYYFVLQSLHKARTSNTLYDKACTKHVPVLLCATKLAEEAPSTYFVVESLHKALPSTTSYYKACTKHFPVLLRTTKLAHKYFPVLLRTTKLAQSTSQYNFNFVLQSLRKAPPSTTQTEVPLRRKVGLLARRARASSPLFSNCAHSGTDGSQVTFSLL